MRKVKELDPTFACYHTLISDLDFPKLWFSEFQEKKIAIFSSFGVGGLAIYFRLFAFR